MKIAVFDVCGTLYKSNTTFDFLDYFFKVNKKYNRFRKITGNIFLVAGNHYINKIFHVDLIRKCAISFLKGFSVEEICRVSQKFLTEFLAESQINNVHELMQHYRDKGYKTILMSASLDFIIKEIHAELNTYKYYSTQLEVVNERYTGKIKFDMSSKKDLVLKQDYKVIESLAVVTDNISDIQLVKSASNRHIICWKNKHSKFWSGSQVNDIQYMNMYS